MDASRMIYELPSMTYGNRVWGVRPVCSHLRIIGDYCSWNGTLVLAGDQTTPIHDTNAYVGQPQANLWFGKTDDLWKWGKPQGWGGVWFREQVRADVPSDPFLMTGFEYKCLHVQHDAGADAQFAIEIDFHGDGNFCRYETLRGAGYLYHVFPTGFSAHWVRLIAGQNCNASAHFVYT